MSCLWITCEVLLGDVGAFRKWPGIKFVCGRPLSLIFVLYLFLFCVYSSVSSSTSRRNIDDANLESSMLREVKMLELHFLIAGLISVPLPSLSNGLNFWCCDHDLLIARSYLGICT